MNIYKVKSLDQRTQWKKTHTLSVRSEPRVTIGLENENEHRSFKFSLPFNACVNRVHPWHPQAV